MRRSVRRKEGDNELKTTGEFWVNDKPEEVKKEIEVVSGQRNSNFTCIGGRMVYGNERTRSRWRYVKIGFDLHKRARSQEERT